KEGLALLLGRRVLPEPARVVAEMLVAGRLDAGEDAHRGIVPGPVPQRGRRVSLMRIEPVAALDGHVAVPGDKSISHRAVLIGAVCEGETLVTGFGRSADTESTTAAMRALGVEIVDADVDTLRIRGVGIRGLRAPSAAVECGNAGTLMRLV